MTTVEFISKLAKLQIHLSVKAGKLSVDVPKGVMTGALLEELKARKSEIIGFLNASNKKVNSIRRVERDAVLPLSYEQEQLWLLDKLRPGQNHFNIPSFLSFTGKMDYAALDKAIGTIVVRHESLRTCFVEDEDGKPQQIVREISSFKTQRIDLSLYSGTVQEGKIAYHTQQELETGFDLANDLMVRVKVLQLGENRNVILVTMHHIASDGWSMSLFINEFSALYSAYVEAEESTLPPLIVQYVDYAYWQRQLLQGERLEQLLGYWQIQLADLPVRHGLPLDSPRPSIQSFGGELYFGSIGKTTVDALNEYCRLHQVTLFMGIQAAFAVLMARYSNENDIVMGSPVANREQQEVAPLIGFFMNNLVLRSDLSANPTFNALVAQTKQMLLDAYAHQQVPFGLVVDRLAPPRDLSHSPLFQVMLTMHNNAEGSLELPGLTLDESLQEGIVAKYDFILNVTENDKGLALLWEYNPDLFAQATMARMSDHLSVLLNTLIAQPEQRVLSANMLSSAEQQRYRQFNENTVDYPKHLGIHQWIAQTARKVPDLVAVQCEGLQLDHRSLEIKANRLAHMLLDTGIEPGQRIGIYLERSIEMVIAILAVMKVGAAYVPLEPGYPVKRIDFILEDADVVLVLLNTSLLKQLPVSGVDIALMDDAATDDQWLSEYPDDCPEQGEPFDSASVLYVLYTSGSTGNPKGVMIPHKGVANYLSHAQTHYLDQDMRGAVVSSPLSFDATLTTLLTPLVMGKTVRLLPDNDNTMSLLAGQLVEQTKPWLFKITPAHLEALGYLLDGGSSSSVAHKIVVGGEQLSYQQIALFRDKVLPNATFINEYGPTETVVGCTNYPVLPKKVLTAAILDKQNGAVPIGAPIGNTRLYVLSAGQQVQPVGCVGELYIGGDGIALGYLNRDSLTASSFVQVPGIDEARLYRTGDLVRWQQDGNLVFLGRIDHQVKVRGFRIELGEVEFQLSQCPQVDSCLVLTTNTQLTAYVKSEVAGQNDLVKSDFVRALKRQLETTLPEHMVPTAYVLIEDWPLTGNGKIDRNTLPSIDGSLLQGEFVAAESDIEKVLAEIWCEVLQLEQISVHANFFETGGNSLLSIKVKKLLGERTSHVIELTDIFEYPSISALSNYLSGVESLDERSLSTTAATDKQHNSDIAVIAMSGRFPGADNVEQFWQNIRDGVESIQFFDDQQLLDAGVDLSVLRHQDFVKSGSLLQGFETFDAPYFGFTPREAELLDPQQRLMLECADEVLEQAGYGDQRRFRNVGVFVGIADSLYLMENLMSNPLVSESAGRAAFFGNTAGFLSTRISYKLNLTGPSLNILTACSTSLVTIHQACISLRENECEMALAGGGRLALLKPGGYLFEEGGIESADGHCRPFDQAAGGTRAGSGVAMVLLKRLDKALADRDTIHAVIKGSAVNNDAADKVGYAAPSIGGQAEVIKKALADAKVAPQTVSLIETHGTGTRIGDPIEIKALQKAYTGGQKGTCALGALKANIGHLDTAAGAAGLIKVVQALKHQQLPPSINFAEPNNQIHFEQTPFYVNTELKPWLSDGAVRRAGISSFGIGGTNAHVVLEQAPAVTPSEGARATHLLTLSAKSKPVLRQMAQNLADFLQQNPGISLHDVAYTLQLGRTRHEYSAAISIGTIEQAIEALQSLPKPTRDRGARHSVVFMFPGQGAQYVNMARQLYQLEPHFKDCFDQCSDVLMPLLAVDLVALMFPGLRGNFSAEEASEQLKQTQITQPALFVTEYCIARLLMGWGVMPDAMIGHSVGEYVAACLAGVFTLSDALHLVSIRGKLMQQVAPGSMLSVSIGTEQLVPLLAQTNTCLAAVNASEHNVAAGNYSDINRLIELLCELNIEHQLVPTSHAFHSKMMDSVLQQFRTQVDKVELKAPTMRYVSNVSGGYITLGQAQDAQYWVDHLRGTVRFADGIETLLSDRQLLQSSKILIEVGPGTTLSSLARKHPEGEGKITVNTLRHRNETVCDVVNLQRVVGKLWGYSLPIDWQAFHLGKPGRRIQLPTYPFERERYWIDADKPSDQMPNSNGSAKQAFEHWWYVPSWRQMPVFKKDKLLKDSSDNRWLLIMDKAGVAEGVAGCLKSVGQQVILARQGDRFAQLSPDQFQLDIRNPNDYRLLLNAIGGKESISRLLHMASVEVVSQSNQYDLTDFRTEQQVGAYSVLHTFQAIIKAGLAATVAVDIVTNDVSRISGDEIIHPGKATLLSLSKVAPQEYPELECHHIDVKLHDYHNSAYVSQLSRHIYSELMLKQRSPSIALRGNQRWEKHFVNNTLGVELAPAQTLKDGGVYLITGGMGNIGLLLANYIAKAVNSAKLVLLGRTPLPSEREWAQIMAADEDQGLCNKIANIKAIRAHGAEVAVFAVDVADGQQMAVLFEGIESRWGAITGVIHCAGQIHGSVKALVETNEQDFVDQYRSKVEGVMVLDELFSTRQIDFCLLMSSLSSVLGGLGFSAYAACNLFMDAFVQKKHDLGDDRWLSVNWDGWDFSESEGVEIGGMAFAMTPSQGELAFAQVLASAYYPQIIQSTGSLDMRLSQWINQDTTAKQTLYVRPELDTDYVAPDNEIEQQLVTIWQDILGIEQIGVDDHFFDLGGDSLIATRVISAIRQTFNVDEGVFSIREFFENPVIKHVAAQIAEGQVDKLAMEKKSQLIESGKNVEEGFL